MYGAFCKSRGPRLLDLAANSGCRLNLLGQGFPAQTATDPTAEPLLARSAPGHTYTQMAHGSEYQLPHDTVLEVPTRLSWIETLRFRQGKPATPTADPTGATAPRALQ